MLERKQDDEENEEEEIAAHIGGGEPLVGDFAMGFNVASSNEDEWTLSFLIISFYNGWKRGMN